MAGTIKITGRCELSRKPDGMELSLRLFGNSEDYGEALSKAVEGADEVKEAVVSCGVAAEKLKTADFGVHPRYESFRDENGNYSQRFVGYEYNESLTLRLPRDNELLGRLLEKVAALSAKPEFSLSFFLLDPESAKNELIAGAVTDSRKKAQVLCEAAGVRLGELLNIDYSWESAEIVVRSVNRMAFASEKMADMAMEPEDVRLSDSVTVTWEIG